MASHNYPAWLDDVTATKRAVVKACGLDWTTLPRAFWFGKEPQPVIVAPIITQSDLSENEWRLLRPFFPSGDRKNAAPVRLYLNGALFQRAARCRFCHIPKRYGSVQALRKRLEDWATRGNFATLLDALATGSLDELAPERKASLVSLSRDWSARGMKYAAARERRA